MVVDKCETWPEGMLDQKASPSPAWLHATGPFHPVQDHGSWSCMSSDFPRHFCAVDILWRIKLNAPQNVTDPEKPFTYQYKIRVPNYAQRTGKRLFLQPGFFEYGNKPIFSDSTRVHDIYFKYPWSENDDIQIELPKTYATEPFDLPPNITDNSDIANQKINITVDKDQTMLQYKREFYFGKGGRTLFPAKAYTPLKGLFDRFQQTNSFSMTLKQKV